MKIRLFAAAALLAGSTVALAQDSDEGDARQTTTDDAIQTQVEKDEGENPGEEIRCRTERVTGSLTRRRRICLTNNEWAALEARTRDDMIRAGRNASGGAACVQDQFGGC